MNGVLSTLDSITNEYQAGIYVRLSRDDEGSGESESIQNQKEYVTKYISDKGWNIFDIYCDDGYSGTNFDRPGFKRMIEDINMKKINMVVTKDFSRLGREYIETGSYVEKFFPSRGIRYIAINDNIDTITYNAMTPFMSVINDMYAGDISRKVKTIINTKRNNGEFVGPFAPYGYQKSPQNKNKLIIDTEAAGVVKRIFELYLEGNGFKTIAEKLNDKCIVCPSRYKKLKYRSYSNPRVKVNLWSHETVKQILCNPTYEGHLAQHKYSTINYKIKKLVTLPKDQWIVVPDTHEPIITKESFGKVQQMIAHRSITSYGATRADHVLGGFIFCGDCGEKLTFSKSHSSGKYYCICSRYKRFRSKYCSRHSIEEDKLLKFVADDIRRLAQDAISYEKLLPTALKSSVTDKGPDIRSQLEKINIKLLEIKQKIRMLYEDRVKGIVMETDFMELSEAFNKDRETLLKRQIELNAEKMQANLMNSETGFLINHVKQYVEFSSIDRVIIAKLVERIDIYQDKTIHIHYRFKCPY